MCFLKSLQAVSRVIEVLSRGEGQAPGQPTVSFLSTASEFMVGNW